MKTSDQIEQTDYLSRVESLKNELDSLRPLDAEAEQRIMQKFRLDWNYHSNHLEGTQLTYGETKALLLFGITAQGKPLKDHVVITGHNEAINEIIEVLKGEYPLTEMFIRQLHTLLLKESYYSDAVTIDGQPARKLIQVGTYKTSTNHVLTQTGETFYFASPEETPAKMMDLIQWFRDEKEKEDVNPIILAAEFHYKFIRIHPFDDGNGRLARLLMNFVLMQFGYPPVIIKSEDKNNYLSVLQQADVDIFEPFVKYIAENLERSLEIMIRGAKGESIEEPNDLDKEIALLEQRVRNVGKKIEVVKSREALQSLLDHSMTNLMNSVTETGKRFDRFYLEKGFEINFNGLNIQHAYEQYGDPVGLSSKYLETEIDEDEIDKLIYIKLVYSHHKFNQDVFDSFGHNSEIHIKLDHLHYLVYCRHSPGHSEARFTLLFKKIYTEALTDEELAFISSSLGRKHKDFIEKTLDAFESKDKAPQ